MIKYTIIIAVLLLTGCSSAKKDVEDQEVVVKTQATIKIMEDFAKQLPFGRSFVKDAWGHGIYYRYEVSKREPYENEKILTRYAKLVLPENSENIKFLGNEWVQFTAEGVTTIVRIPLPRLYKETVTAIILSSPGYSRPSGEINHRVERKFQFIRGNIYENGKAYGSVMFSCDGHEIEQ